MAPEEAAQSLTNCLKSCYLCQCWLELKTTSLKMKKPWGCGVRKRVEFTEKGAAVTSMQSAVKLHCGFCRHQQEEHVEHESQYICLCCIDV